MIRFVFAGLLLLCSAAQAAPAHQDWLVSHQPDRFMDRVLMEAWADADKGPTRMELYCDTENGFRLMFLPHRALIPEGPSQVTLTARRLGIARQASCAAAADAAVAAVLTRNGCAAMLRATYVDGTGSYVVTVGVGVMPGSAQAAAADRELPPVSRDPGVHAVRFAGTPAAWFTNSRRQLSASVAAGTYVFFYTIGYADDRPRVPVAADSYADAEMTSLGRGVARAVDLALTLPVPAPHCPGTAGC